MKLRDIEFKAKDLQPDVDIPQDIGKEMKESNACYLRNADAKHFMVNNLTKERIEIPALFGKCFRELNGHKLCDYCPKNETFHSGIVIPEKKVRWIPGKGGN